MVVIASTAQVMAVASRHDDQMMDAAAHATYASTNHGSRRQPSGMRPAIQMTRVAMAVEPSRIARPTAPSRLNQNVVASAMNSRRMQ